MSTIDLADLNAIPPAPKPAPPRNAQPAPSLGKQIALGLAIFAGILAPSLPFAFVSEGLALATAVGVGSVLVALLARRLLIALLIATLLAVLGAFATAHSIHVALETPGVTIRLANLAPAAGVAMGAAPTPAVPAVIVFPARADFGSQTVPVAGWAFPGALFVLWALGFAAIRANRALVRWLIGRWRRSSPAA